MTSALRTDVEKFKDELLRVLPVGVTWNDGKFPNSKITGVLQKYPKYATRLACLYLPDETCNADIDSANNPYYVNVSHSSRFVRFAQTLSTKASEKLETKGFLTELDDKIDQLILGIEPPQEGGRRHKSRRRQSRKRTSSRRRNRHKGFYLF
jgi:hypothetical protein